MESETEIKEAFEFLSSHPGCLTILERDLIEGFKKYFKEHGSLSESQRNTLFELKKWRQKSDQRLY